ncbi:hypothetical protein WJX72_000524 [[Myrmecia] bisecta]|uniref:RCC1-like domain-containing protein n=1 Tax=[Myrmecia] bisecta TaxID=41462 RepID=A0AAW1PTQ9_9CHLO
MSTPARRLLACWGNGDFGRLGHGIECLSEEFPRLCAALPEISVSHVICGGAHTTVTTAEGNVWAFGLNDAGQLGHSVEATFVPVPRIVPLPEPVSQVAAGHYHTLFLTQAGNVWACGRNHRGQLGVSGAAACDVRHPIKIPELAGADVVSIAAGAEHSLAVTRGGEVYSWGCGGHGRLGHGKASIRRLLNRDEKLPRLVKALAPLRVERLAAGHMHSGCVDSDGYVHVWGYGRFWQLGLTKDEDVSAPQQVASLHSIRSLAFGGSHSLAIQHDGRVLAWGANQNGSLGLGRDDDQTARVPTAVANLRADQVAAGWKHSLAVGAGGRLFTWGWGGSMGTPSAYEQQLTSGGQLGLGNDFDYWIHTNVEWLQLDEVDLIKQSTRDGHQAWRVVQASCGFNHTAAVIEMLG